MGTHGTTLTPRQQTRLAAWLAGTSNAWIEAGGREVGAELHGEALRQAEEARCPRRRGAHGAPLAGRRWARRLRLTVAGVSVPAFVWKTHAAATTNHHRSRTVSLHCGCHHRVGPDRSRRVQRGVWRTGFPRFYGFKILRLLR